MVLCSQCAFLRYEDRTSVHSGALEKMAFCRANPPQVVVVDGKPKSVLPVVYPKRGDGCGLGEAKE